MDYIKIRFGSDFDRLDSRFEKTAEEMFRSINPMFRISERVWKPQMDIYETPEEIFILAEISGVKKEELEIEVSTKAVKIYGRRAELPRVENATYRLAEIQYGKFERILFLPAPIDTEKVTASYSDGFLKLRIAKLRYDDRTYKIPITD
ncbi:Hsp20/alpha crystallin family protein [Desulfonema magnum]|uniref:Heat shock protein, Hsp 20 family n=1 Tax=Desulfonema magnum TaxID=45655 RepID=A0A975BLM7_9BACT|nr:Hsp20/alpha crystallin family protein [Desulfonema magnum]QTA87713.1 Heat shock protein, Hsp 20 family [Desulfonema magnum]